MPLNRREFIQILTAAVAVYPLSSLAKKRQAQKNTSSLNEPWLTLSTVQEHLFPSEANSIGASDINALAYLQSMMLLPDFEKEKQQLIHNGVGWLNDLSQQKHAKKFHQLDWKMKEDTLRQVEQSRAGSRWLSTLLTYLLEALLSDPIYEGNPKGIGWTWLNHQPGFPRPTEDKKYFKLQQRRYRTTKA